MSSAWIVLSLNAEMHDWLQESGVSCVDIAANGRAAILEELKNCVSQLDHFSHRVHVFDSGFQLSIKSWNRRRIPCTGRWANSVAPGVIEFADPETLIDGKTESEGQIAHISFQGDLALMVRIVQLLTVKCGPQVIMHADTAEGWIIADADSPPMGNEILHT